MDERVKMIMASLVSRFHNTDFLNCEVQAIAAGKSSSLHIEPEWESRDFVVLQKPGGKQVVKRDKLEEILAHFLSPSSSFSLVVRDRTSEFFVEHKKGKVTTRISQRTASQPKEEAKHSAVALAPGTRQDFIKANEAQEMLKAIGIMAPDGQIKGDKRRKLYQVDRFVELLSQMLEQWPENKELVVLDCGCGKSYLSFALNYYLHEKLRKKCFFIGIDNNQDVIASSGKIQQQLGYRNMEFVHADVKSFEPGRKVDMVLSLHACDTATDQAIALGLRGHAKYIIAVPCCQVALNDELEFGPFSAVTKHNVFKTRMADLLTDGLRTLALEAHGYKVSVAEYVSPLDTPKNIMIRAEKAKQQGNTKPYEDLKKLLKVSPWIDKLL